MEDHKLTPWFGGHDKPARKGVYMLHSGASVGYQYWNGFRWFAWCNTPDGAVRSKHMPASACFQNDNWRGLTKKPPNVRVKPAPTACHQGPTAENVQPCWRALVACRWGSASTKG